MRHFALPVFAALALAACESEPAAPPAVADPQAGSMDMSTVDTQGSGEEVAASPMPRTEPGITVTDGNGTTVTTGPGGTATMTAEEIDARFGVDGVKVDTTPNR
ncbi:hypothetical protein [Qipengyuania sp.]|uniref:hypothetical protein n=1 Tax=Qipengyuania sp. TaxID=2004515 RepID=UPI0035C84753